MYKLLVSSFYDTLIDDDEAISLSTMVEIDRIRKNGVLFCVTTEGNYLDVCDYNKDFDFIDYIIACNGAYLYDVLNKKVIFKKNIMPSMIKKIWKNYSKYDVYFYTGIDKVLIKKNFLFDEFYNENKTDIYKIDISFTDKKLRDSVYDEIGELELKVSCNKYDKNKKYIIEITALNINKLSSIEFICRRKKISLMEVVSIGQKESDICMLNDVGMSCCVANANNDVKKVAKMKSSSNVCKGVEKVIKKFF